MSENSNDLIQGLMKQLTSVCKEQVYSFDQPLEYTAENITRLNAEAIRQVERLIYSRDIVVDMSLKVIYLKGDVPLDVLTLLPLRYPEMDPVPCYRHTPYFSAECLPKVKEITSPSYMMKKNGEILGHVSYHGPNEGDPKNGIIAVGHKTSISLEKPVKRSIIDIDIEVPKTEDNHE